MWNAKTLISKWSNLLLLTYLKLCPSVFTHNFKWVENIQIWYQLF